MFNDDLKTGEVAEDYVADELESHLGIKFKKVDFRHNNYDLESEKGTRIEVKYDKRWKETGNVAIELTCDDTDSGVMSTDADYLAYLLFPDVYIAKTHIIKNILHRFRIVNGGDGDKCRLALIPIKEFKKIFHKLK